MIDTENEIEKDTARKFQKDNDEILNQSLRNSENKKLSIEKKNDLNQNLNKNNIENIEETESEIGRKKQEKLNKEYNKYEININKAEGNDTNIINSLLPNKCILILRIIIYNFIRPIYLYLFIVSILLCIPTYSDLPVIISIIIYLIMICTSIVIEILEETKSQNRNIFFDEKTKFTKITNNKILNIPGKNIQKGDIIVVKNGDSCPCDMILIDSSINEIPLYFQSDCLSGNFNFNVRLIKKSILEKFSTIKKEFEPKFSEFLKNLREEEIQKMLEE